ncbi:hypothetical protein [Streptomyces lomondensis]|uniref:Uncharacterized protein n=1 Tax=Streptomyces lomondensis TaxID=68229 RepID=A0ABQ2X142_9ACTN|nr:hypothetical protein [Streptomyces lomondensis]MCF0081823.1 hypothetical protein [Streptomyces lomondensis]GGW90847.1 hypothetical protein GCM10010383_20630 [Streptomyces lomondensis]
MTTGKSDICGWLGRLLPAVVLLACLLAWLPLQAGVWPSLLVGVVRASRRPRGGGSVLRWGAGVCVDVVLSSVVPYVRPVRRRTLWRVVTVCAVLCLPVTGRRR